MHQALHWPLHCSSHPPSTRTRLGSKIFTTHLSQGPGDPLVHPVPWHLWAPQVPFDHPPSRDSGFQMDSGDTKRGSHVKPWPWSSSACVTLMDSHIRLQLIPLPSSPIPTLTPPPSTSPWASIACKLLGPGECSPWRLSRKWFSCLGLHV